MTPERLQEITQFIRLYGSANCWTGTLGQACTYIHELMEHHVSLAEGIDLLLDEREHESDCDVEQDAHDRGWRSAISDLRPRLRELTTATAANAAEQRHELLGYAATAYKILRNYMLSLCTCPCCEGIKQCHEECTFADDCPSDASILAARRQACERAEEALTGGRVAGRSHSRPVRGKRKRRSHPANVGGRTETTPAAPEQRTPR